MHHGINPQHGTRTTRKSKRGAVISLIYQEGNNHIHRVVSCCWLFTLIEIYSRERRRLRRGRGRGRRERGFLTASRMDLICKTLNFTLASVIEIRAKRERE